MAVASPNGSPVDRLRVDGFPQTDKRCKIRSHLCHSIRTRPKRLVLPASEATRKTARSSSVFSRTFLLRAQGPAQMKLTHRFHPMTSSYRCRTALQGFFCKLVPQRGLFGAARLTLRVGLRPIKLAAPICRTGFLSVRGSNGGRSATGADMRYKGFFCKLVRNVALPHEECYPMDSLPHLTCYR
jgi:hypothetical protein